MPDERGGYFERLQAEMTSLDQLHASLTVSIHKRDELRGKLLGNPGGEAGVSATPSPTIPRTSMAIG